LDPEKRICRFEQGQEIAILPRILAISASSEHQWLVPVGLKKTRLNLVDFEQ
jgi:hypothetical protein